MPILMILLQALSAADTTSVAGTAEVAASSSFGGFVDIAYKLSMVAIAAFNIFYVIRLNKTQSQDKENQRKSERRMDLLKTIVLIPNLKKSYGLNLKNSSLKMKQRKPQIGRMPLSWKLNPLFKHCSPHSAQTLLSFSMLRHLH